MCISGFVRSWDVYNSGPFVKRFNRQHKQIHTHTLCILVRELCSQVIKNASPIFEKKRNIYKKF